jgi:hypothetical protein
VQGSLGCAFTAAIATGRPRAWSVYGSVLKVLDWAVFPLLREARNERLATFTTILSCSHACPSGGWPRALAISEHLAVPGLLHGRWRLTEGAARILSV